MISVVITIIGFVLYLFIHKNATNALKDFNGRVCKVSVIKSNAHENVQSNIAKKNNEMSDNKIQNKSLLSAQNKEQKMTKWHIMNFIYVHSFIHIAMPTLAT